ncbi:MAG: diguanylate cyclase domain-containing protein [Candidatus Bathyarchaeota archaeon]
MGRFRDISIRNKLMVIIMATCCTALLLGGMALIVRYAASEQEKTADRLLILARVIGANLAAAVSFDEPASAGEILGGLAAEPSIRSAYVYDSRGRLFARYGAAGQDNSAPLPGTATVSGQLDRGGLVGILFTEDSLRVSAPIILDGEGIGSIVVDAGLEQLRLGLIWDVAVLTAIIVASGFCALALSLRLQKIISDPISRLAATMRRVSQVKDYGLCVAREGNDEIGALIDGFNAMLAQINARDEQLERRRQQLEDAHRIALLGNWEWDARDNRMELSPEACRILGLADLPTPSVLAAFMERIHPDDRDDVRRSLAAAMEADCPLDLEHRVVGPGDTIRHLHLRGEVRRSPARQPIGVGGSLQDISERVWAEERIRIAANALEHTGDAVVIADPKLRIVSANKAFTFLTGHGREEVVGRRPGFLLSGKHAPAFYIGIWRQILRSGQWQGEIWGTRRNGEVYPQLVSISAVRDRAGKASHYVFVSNDISHYKRHEASLEYLAHHDALTQLPNRVLFDAELDRALRRAQRHGARLGVMFIDLDHFKGINDTLGHAVGDLLLQSASARIRNCLRQSDLVARQGGDEFTVLLDDFRKAHDAERIAQKIVDELARPFILAGHELRISASVGVGCYPEDGDTAEGLLKHADAAMYAAKEEGRNGYRLSAGTLGGAPSGDRLCGQFTRS